MEAKSLDLWVERAQKCSFTVLWDLGGVTIVGVNWGFSYGGRGVGHHRRANVTTEVVQTRQRELSWLGGWKGPRKQAW